MVNMTRGTEGEDLGESFVITMIYMIQINEQLY